MQFKTRMNMDFPEIGGKLRDERKFSSPEHLAAQISRDITQAKLKF